MVDKVTSIEAATGLIENGDTITTSGFVGIGVPEALLKGLKQRFLETGNPRDLTLFFAAGQGDGKEKGLNHLGQEGMLKKVIGGHWGLIPKVGNLAVQGRIEAYNLPQGVISQLFRDIAAGKPGLLTKVGTGTFVDPRISGGKINDITKENLVEIITLGGEEYLFYKAMPIDVALLRGTTADPLGNITMEREALVIDNLSQAMAAKNSGGVVIVQVERVAAAKSLNPREVVIPGALVDAVVVADSANHMQTFRTVYSHTFAGKFKAPPQGQGSMSLGARKIIARRAAFELPINGLINLGIGMPEGVAQVAAEEGLLDHLTLTAEPGVIGGKPASGLDFGAAENNDAVVAQSQQFDLYDGGGLDLAVLGMAQINKDGSVNVSRFGPRLAGAGGFINISQNAKKLVFAGTFMACELALSIADKKLSIEKEGLHRKFIASVDQITFSGPHAASGGQPVFYVTERCVFALTEKGIALIEVAPGIDVKKDILAHMDFMPLIEEWCWMDERIFAEVPMGLKSDLLYLDLAERIALDPSRSCLFLNFEKMRIRNKQDVLSIKKRVEEVCQGLDQRVDVVANYDGTRIDEDIENSYSAMVASLEQRYYRTVTRYSASGFMRLKLRSIFQKNQSPHVFETKDQARQFLGFSS